MVLDEPEKFTTELEIKLVPLTVRVKPVSPAVLEVGDILVVVGTGLPTVKVCALDVPPPGVGFVTVISKVPAVVKSPVSMAAVT